MRRLSRKRKSYPLGRALPYALLFSLFIIFFFTKVPEKLFPLEDRLITQALRNRLALSQAVRREHGMSTHENLPFLEERIQLLENELSLRPVQGKYEYVPAWVLFKSPFQNILVERTSDEVSKGDAVLAPDGTLIGFVEEVYPKSIRVRLVSSNGEEVQAILVPGDLTLTLRGDGKNLTGEVPRELEISEGDILFAQCLPETPVGEVVSIDFDPRDPSKRFTVQAPFALSQIQSVLILPGTSELCFSPDETQEKTEH